MEAVAAVSLVGTICSLIDFSAKILSQSWRLHRASDEAQTQCTDVERLSSVLNFLKAEQVLMKGSVDDSVKALSDRATVVTGELLELLRTYTIQDGRHKLKAAFKSVTQRDRVKELNQKLNSLLIEAQTHYSLLIRLVFRIKFHQC
jgi:hypothetical protein